MADTKLTALTAVTGVADAALAYVVVDPSGTPASRKITVAELVGHSTAGQLDPTGTTDAAAAIEAAASALDAAGGGILQLPEGTFKIASTLTLYSKVSYRGVGTESTILKSSTAVPMFQRLGDVAIGGHRHYQIANLSMDGNSTGTIGLNIRMGSAAVFKAITIHDFTTYGADLQGFLLNRFDECVFYNLDVGVRQRAYTTSPGAEYWQSNINLYNNCQFTYCASWAFKNDRSAMTVFDTCDFEHNGTAADDATGVLLFENACPDGEDNVVTMRNVWAEANRGYAFLKLAQPLGADVRAVLRDSHSFYNTGANVLKYGVYVDGAGGGSNKMRLFTSGCKFGDHSVYDVLLSAGGAYWEREATAYSSVSTGSGHLATALESFS